MTRARRADPPRSHAAAVAIAFAGAVMLLPAALVFAPLGAFGTPAAVIGLAAFVLWLASRVHPESAGAFGAQPLRLAIVVFLAALLASYVAATLRVLPGIETRGADRALLGIVAVSGIALLVMDGIHSMRQLDRLLRVVVICGGVVAAVGLLQFAIGFDVVRLVNQLPFLTANRELALVKSRVAITRVSGTAMHPIEFGVVCAMVLPLALHYARRTPRNVAAWIPAVLLGLAIPASVSRSGVIALLVGMIIYIAVWPPRQRLLALAAGVLMLAPARVVAPGLLGTLTKLFLHAGSDASVAARTEDYKTTADTIVQHFWLGRGFGTYLPPTAPILDNQFLGQLVETGIVGLLALLMVGAVAIGCARGARRRSPDPEMRDLAQALAASVAAGFITFATYDFLGFALGTGLFFLFLGSVGALWRLAGGTRAWTGAPTPAAVA